MNDNNTTNRGLASADEKTRQRVARMGGIASGAARSKKRNRQSPSQGINTR